MSDPINPPHYQGFSNGAEVIDLTENLSYNAGNAVKYLCRAGRLDGKNKGNVLEDLKKSLWYVTREIERIDRDTWPEPAQIGEKEDNETWTSKLNTSQTK